MTTVVQPVVSKPHDLPDRVHIIGAGLIGTSLGLALGRVGVTVTLSDISAEHLDHAINAGAGVRPDTSHATPDIVVVATPPHEVAANLVSSAQEWPDATLTDVASVKVAPIVAATHSGAPPSRLIGGHPMAGREISGPLAARADLFDDRVWVLCPGEDSEPERLKQLINVVAACGALPVVMTASDHDQAVAFTSHVPQILSSTLASGLLSASGEALQVSGQGLRDMTRIAESDPELWQSILTMNGVEVSTVLADIIGQLTVILEDLAGDSDGIAIGDVLARGVQGRARIPGKHGLGSREYSTITVLVKDEAGELARLFVAAGDLEVNLEDVRIEHVLGRPSGLIDLYVRPSVAETLRVGLRERGFDVRG